MRKTLFRPGLAAARAVTWHGNAMLLQPVSMRLIAAAIILFAFASLVFLSQAHYTRHIAAFGVLAPDTGLINVQSPQAGVILERRVREGQSVHAGDVLYVVTAEVVYAPQSNSAARAGATATQLKQLLVRKELLQADSLHAAAIERREREELQANIRSLLAELQQLDQEIAIQQARVKAKNEVYERHEQAQLQGFLSPLALQQKYDELLDYKARLQAVQRTRLGLSRDLESAQVQLDTVDQRNALARSQRTRQDVDLQQDRVTHEAHQRTLVTAPQDGVVVAVLAEPGQRVDHDTMLTIVPRTSKLEVQVILPSSAVGFIREGDPVTLRFDAFPYQRYGSVGGTIREISHAVLAAPDMVRAASSNGGGEGFRVRIVLPSQSFAVAGRRFPLRSGMKVETRFAQERHSLLSWLIDPLAMLADKT